MKTIEELSIDELTDFYKKIGQAVGAVIVDSELVPMPYMVMVSVGGHTDRFLVTNARKIDAEDWILEAAKRIQENPERAGRN